MKYHLVILGSIFVASCVSTPAPPKTAQLREIDVNGKTYAYRSTRCGHTVSPQGFKVDLEGVNVPNAKEPLSFTIGKVGYEVVALNQITATLKKLDDLQNSACQTLVRLKDEENIIKYSEYRDNIYKEMISFAENLDVIDSQEEALAETEKVNQKADEIEAPS